MKSAIKLVTIGITALLLITLCITPAAAEERTTILDRISDWTGWTYEHSTYLKNTIEWIQDVKTHIRTIITDRSKSFEDRAKSQAYALGWDDRFDYIEKYGTINEETGEITYDIPALDWIFGGLKFRERWFTNNEDYQQAMNIYNENYNNAVQAVPKEV